MKYSLTERDIPLRQSGLLGRSIYLLFTPIFLLLAVIACVGTGLIDLPRYTCPTPIPPPPQTTVLPGTSTPLPLPTQVPPTPYVITPPREFYVGDAVYVGNEGAALRVRFRLQNVQIFPAPEENGQTRNVYAWELEVKNVGTQDYEIFPAVQMILRTITTTQGDIDGQWGSSSQAAQAAGLVVASDVYTLTPSETRIFKFAAFGPAGTARRFSFMLNPTAPSNSNTIVWQNTPNPLCSGDIADE